MNYTSQMKAWAIDRALETLKLNTDQPIKPDMVMEVALKYCEFTHDPIAAEEEAKILADKKAEEAELARKQAEGLPQAVGVA